MRTGELFAGVGGLGMAVDEVFGSTPAWFAEFDAAPSKVLAHHFPNVPNYGDVTKVDWAAVEQPQILAGGFPCQDVSLAGRRRGMKDGTRSLNLQDVVEYLPLLPTPTVGNATGGNAQRGGGRSDERLLPGIAVDAAARLLPTPTAMDSKVDADWGPYSAAISRWQRLTGQFAPAPVRFDGKGGRPRLNPELTEWMMGWPVGWVTAPEIGLTRTEQLKACGNGVVPQQAAAALRELLSRPGVPTMQDVGAA